MPTIRGCKKCNLVAGYSEGDDANISFGKDRILAQTFPISAETVIFRCRLKQWSLDPRRRCIYTLRATDGAGVPTGPPLAECGLSESGWKMYSPGKWRRFDFMSFPVLAPGQYALCTAVPTAPDAVRYKTRADQSIPGYVDGMAYASDDAGATWHQLPSTDFLFEIWGWETPPVEPDEDVISNWGPTDIEPALTLEGYTVQVTTDIPIHLWMRWTKTEPLKHPSEEFRRGILLKTGLRWCFVSFCEVEQEEAGDTYVHTFYLPTPTPALHPNTEDWLMLEQWGTYLTEYNTWVFLNPPPDCTISFADSVITLTNEGHFDIGVDYTPLVSYPLLDINKGALMVAIDCPEASTDDTTTRIGLGGYFHHPTEGIMHFALWIALGFTYLASGQYGALPPPPFNKGWIYIGTGRHEIDFLALWKRWRTTLGLSTDPSGWTVSNFHLALGVENPLATDTLKCNYVGFHYPFPPHCNDEEWPVCQTRWFYFVGTKQAEYTPSASPIFYLHRYEIPITNYPPTWHNRYIGSSHGTWAIARNGSSLKLSGDYQRPPSLLSVGSTLIGLYAVTRAWLNFNTQDLGEFTSARLGIYVTDTVGIVGSLIITKGLCREPIDEDDWTTQTNEVTVLGSILQNELVLNEYNWIELNEAGIAWLKQSALEIAQHESYDWLKTAYLLFYPPYWRAQSYTPQTTHTLAEIRLRLRRKGNPGILNIRIRAADVNHLPTGPDLATGNINANTLATTGWGAWYLIDLGAGIVHPAGTEYCVILEAPGSNSSNYVEWIGATNFQYPNGLHALSANNGLTWSPQAQYDGYFIEYGFAQVGGTNLCLRTAFDVNDVPPIAVQNQVVKFHSAQKGDGFLPILEITA